MATSPTSAESTAGPSPDVTGPRPRAWGDSGDWITFLTGGFGVLSGFSLFFLMIDKADSPLLFLGVLGIASALSAIFEGLRERIERGHAGPQPKSISRFFVFVVILAVAEVHGMSWESLTQISSSREFLVVVHTVLGSSVTDSTGVFLDLVVLLGFWVLSGAVLSVALLRQLKSATGSLGQRVRRGALHGAMAGALIAPLCLFAYVLLIWLGRGLYLLVFAQDTWRANLEQLRAWSEQMQGWVGPVFEFAFTALQKGSGVVDGPWGPPLAVAAAVVTVAVLVRHELTFPAFIVAIATAAVVIAPLLLGLDALMLMLLRASLVWLVPGLVLGAMAPLLKETSETQRPRVWAGVAFASAVVLFVITAFRFASNWWLLAPSALLAGLGYTLRRASRADDYWLPMAVAISVLVCGATLGVQSATSFVGVYDALHGLTSLPSELPQPRAVAVVGDSLGVYRNLQQRWVGRLTSGGGLGVAVPENLETRLQRTREIRREVEALRRERDGQPLDASPWEVDREPTSDGDRGARKQDLFEYMDQTISGHRVIADRIAGLQSTRGEVQALRRKIAAIKLTATVLSDFAPVSGATQNVPARQELGRLNREITAIRDELLAGIDRDLATLQKAADRLTERRVYFAGRERELRETIVRWLELALAGSVGYWTAISLLVGWSAQRGLREGQGTPRGPVR